MTVDNQTSGADTDAPGASRRLRRAPGGRKTAITVRVSDEELIQLSNIAASLGVSKQRLMLEAALARRTLTATEVTATRVQLKMARRQVAAVRLLLADVAAVAARNGEPLPPAFTALSDDVARTLRGLRAAARALPKGDGV